MVIHLDQIILKMFQNSFQKKIRILKLYKNEIPKGNHTRSLKNIIRLSEARGSSVGLKNAESFQLYREINL